MDACTGDHLVSCLDRFNQLLLLLALLLLRADQKEVEDNADEDQRGELRDGIRSLCTGGGGGIKE